MPEKKEIHEKYSVAEQAVRHARECCQTTQSVPSELKDSVQELDQRIAQVREQILAQEESQIRDCIEELEDLSDRARTATSNGGGVEGELRDAVWHAHRHLADLKHQLH